MTTSHKTLESPMPHDDKIKQLEERRAFALAMGGEKRLEKHRANGNLDVKETKRQTLHLLTRPKLALWALRCLHRLDQAADFGVAGPEPL